MADSKSNSPALSFEEAIEQLETLIDQIEGGDIGLEASLQQYESGTHLIQHCREILDAAEQRITELVIPQEAASEALPGGNLDDSDADELDFDEALDD